jgi:serine/threonine-protein kinase
MAYNQWLRDSSIFQRGAFAWSGKRMAVRLAVTEGPHRGQDFTFTEHDLFLVGRSRSAHFRLPEVDFNPFQFLVEVNPPGCRITDLGSHQGTYVNGKTVEVADLRDGDLIQAGTTVLRLTVEAPEKMPATDRHRALSLSTDPSSPGLTQVRRPRPWPVGHHCLACGASLRTHPPDPLCSNCRDKSNREDQPVPGYRVVKELGQGTMGVVSLALRTQDDRPVALKSVIPETPGSRDAIVRFLREVRILQHLDHPQLVPFLEMGQGNGRLFFASEYVPGQDAAHLVKEQGPLTVSRAVALTCQLLQGLEYAQSQGFVHCDIKPQNLLIRADPEAPGLEIVQLADFGLARAFQASPLSGLTALTVLGDAAAFTPPERITAFRDCKPSADQYSSGATLYYLLASSSPYDLPKKVIKQLMMVLLEDPIPILHRRPDLPVGLAEIIHRSLARHPEDRFPDVWTMRAALTEFA